MSAGSWVIGAFLALAVVFSWIGAAGLVMARGAVAKLHFTALLGSLAIPCGCIALMVQHGVATVTVKALLLALFSGMTNAVLTHATARACRVAELGDWRIRPEDKATELEAG